MKLKALINIRLDAQRRIAEGETFEALSESAERLIARGWAEKVTKPKDGGGEKAGATYPAKTG